MLPAPTTRRGAPATREALRHVREGRDPLIVTGTASGKSLCYVLPILEALLANPRAKALLLFPTKALCQDQFKGFGQALEAARRDCENDAESLRRQIIERIENESSARVDYVAIVSTETFEPLRAIVPDATLVALAAHWSAARLIDNIRL